MSNSLLSRIDMSQAAQRAASLVNRGDILGLGSGSAVAKFAQALGKRVKSDKLSLQVVPSSLQAAFLARENGLALFSGSHCPAVLDIAIDGADQVATETRAMIKGGGGQLLKEKIVLSCAKRKFILIDKTKLVNKLSQASPIETVQFSLDSVRNRLEKDFDARPVLRKLEKDYPYYTESGNLIFDTSFGEISNPKTLESSVKCIPGVVEVGIFNFKIDRFLVADQNGSVEEI